jgi:hypothetical protein
LSGVAQSFLPPGAFALYSHIASQEGGVTGFLSNLKNQDLQSVIDEVKKAGGDDAKRIIEKVEKRLHAAKGDVKNIDWKSLVEELKAELPASQQKLVDVSLVNGRWMNEILMAELCRHGPYQGGL